MSSERFHSRMTLLARLGYKTIPLDEACQRLKAGTLDAHHVVITIDDAWFGTYQHMLPALKKHGFSATIYVPTEQVLRSQPVLHLLVAYMVERGEEGKARSDIFPKEDISGLKDPQLTQKILKSLVSLTDDEREKELERIGTILKVDYLRLRSARVFEPMSEIELREASANGLALELHTHTHRMHGSDPELVRSEVTLNREHLTAITGQNSEEFRHFCYPSGEYHSSIFPVLRQMGIHSATTTRIGLNPPRANLMELKRIMDTESMSDLDFEAHLCGFWAILYALRSQCEPHMSTDAA